MNYPTLGQSGWRSIRQKIEPGLEALVYLDETLRLGVCITEEVRSDIEKSIYNLEELYDELIRTDLPQELRVVLLPNIANLIVFLKNYEVLGLDKAYETFSSAAMIAARQLRTQSDPAIKTKVKKALVVLTTGVTILAGVNALIDQTEKLAIRGVDLFKLLGDAQREAVPKLEDKSNRSDDASSEVDI